MSVRLRCTLVVVSALAFAAACGEPPARPAGVGARVTLDRSEAQVGDPIGVTIEIETPAGWSVQTPPAPSGAAFSSDSIERVTPIETPDGLRHPLLWTVRAREVGEQELPWLEIPLVRADGSIQPLRVGGVPLAVVSVRADLPPREAVFDIRLAPPDPPTPIWVWALVAAGIVLAAFTVREIRRRARALRATLGALSDAGQTALVALDDVESSADARSFAGRIRAALVPFVARVWNVDAASTTPAELRDPVDRELVRILQTLERARFAKRPALAPLQPLATQARERVRHVANLRAR